MEVSNSYSRKKWDDGATAEQVAATELDGHQRVQGEPAGFFKVVACTKSESSSPKTIICTSGIAVSRIGDDGIERLAPAFAVLAVSEKEKTENLSFDPLNCQHRYQFQLPHQHQYQPKRAPNSLRWFPFEAIGLDQFNSTSSSTRTPHGRDAFVSSPRRDGPGISLGTPRELRTAREKVSTKFNRRVGGAS